MKDGQAIFLAAVAIGGMWFLTRAKPAAASMAQPYSGYNTQSPHTASYASLLGQTLRTLTNPLALTGNVNGGYGSWQSSTATWGGGAIDPGQTTGAGWGAGTDRPNYDPFQASVYEL